MSPIPTNIPITHTLNFVILNILYFNFLRWSITTILSYVKLNYPLMITIVVIAGSSLLIGIGFAYMGYDSGHFSQAYGLCRDDVLSHQRMGAYHSVDETMEALKSFDVDAS